MPEKVQIESLQTIPGLEKCELVRPGYAIEYDYFPTYQLGSTLESKNIAGLYLAGQMNGTSGYEEAASQGLIAGINAALTVLKEQKFIISRSEGIYWSADRRPNNKRYKRTIQNVYFTSRTQIVTKTR